MGSIFNRPLGSRGRLIGDFDNIGEEEKNLAMYLASLGNVVERTNYSDPIKGAGVAKRKRLGDFLVNGMRVELTSPETVAQLTAKDLRKGITMADKQSGIFAKKINKLQGQAGYIFIDVRNQENVTEDLLLRSVRRAKGNDPRSHIHEVTFLTDTGPVVISVR